MPQRKNKLNIAFALSHRGFWIGAAVLVLLRYLLVHFQQGYTWVGGAPLDDELMFRAANAITNGQWLGAYDYLTLSKSSFFAVWLSFIHAIKLNYLVAGVLLWCGAALVASFAFAPLWQKLGTEKSRAVTLLLFGVLTFSPSSFASYTLRVYRDNIFPALCLYCFAGFAGAILRAALRAAQPQKQPHLWPWLIAAGCGLTCGYLNREDAGVFLLPFAILATVGMLVLLARQKRFLWMAAQAIPYGLLAAGVLTFCTLNNIHYGVFALSDFSEGSFADAMGAMSRVAGDSADDSQTKTSPLVTVNTAMRQKLYEAVPELQPLEYWLEEDEQLQNDFRDPTLDDYRAGSFYWAIRRAAQFEGIYATAATADAYWATVADKINAACDDGTLPSVRGKRSGTTPPITASYILPTLQESVRSLYWVLTFQNCPAQENLRSIGTEEDFATWTGYLHCTFNGAAEAGKDTPYYSSIQKAVFSVAAVLRLVYAVLFPLAFAGAVVLHLGSVPRVMKARTAEQLVPWFLLLGILFAAALRCGMIAFVEVASFGIGTATMYLATVHPLLLLYSVSAWAIFAADRFTKRSTLNAQT